LRFRDATNSSGESVIEQLRHHRRSNLALVGLVVAVLLGVAADLGTKAWAIDNLSGRRLSPVTTEVCVPGETGFMQMDRVRQPPIILIDGFFELRYAENCGAAFGFMNTWSSTAKRLIFIPVALGAVLVLGFMFVAGRGGRFLAMAVPLVISGAIGNFVDRVRYGYVVDFIRFYGETPRPLEWLLGPRWEYPTFNIADVAITLGVAFLLIDGWLEGRRERREALAREAALAAAPRTAEPEDGDGAPVDPVDPADSDAEDGAAPGIQAAEEQAVPDPEAPEAKLAPREGTPMA
jgi:signal peptidase II